MAAGRRQTYLLYARDIAKPWRFDPCQVSQPPGLSRPGPASRHGHGPTSGPRHAASPPCPETSDTDTMVAPPHDMLAGGAAAGSCRSSHTSAVLHKLRLVLHMLKLFIELAISLNKPERTCFGRHAPIYTDSGPKSIIRVREPPYPSAPRAVPSICIPVQPTLSSVIFELHFTCLLSERPTGTSSYVAP